MNIFPPNLSLLRGLNIPLKLTCFIKKHYIPTLIFIPVFNSTQLWSVYFKSCFFFYFSNYGVGEGFSSFHFTARKSNLGSIFLFRSMTITLLLSHIIHIFVNSTFSTILPLPTLKVSIYYPSHYIIFPIFCQLSEATIHCCNYCILS